jgi:hypothetical protein
MSVAARDNLQFIHKTIQEGCLIVDAPIKPFGTYTEYHDIFYFSRINDEDAKEGKYNYRYAVDLKTGIFYKREIKVLWKEPEVCWRTLTNNTPKATISLPRKEGDYRVRQAYIVAMATHIKAYEAIIARGLRAEVKYVSESKVVLNGYDNLYWESFERDQFNKPRVTEQGIDHYEKDRYRSTLTTLVRGITFIEQPKSLDFKKGRYDLKKYFEEESEYHKQRDAQWHYTVNFIDEQLDKYVRNHYRDTSFHYLDTCSDPEGYISAWLSYLRSLEYYIERAKHWYRATALTSELEEVQEKIKVIEDFKENKLEAFKRDREIRNSEYYKNLRDSLNKNNVLPIESPIKPKKAKH